MGHFPQKSPIISGSFAENDLQLNTIYGFSLPCIALANVACSTLGYLKCTVLMGLPRFFCQWAEGQCRGEGVWKGKCERETGKERLRKRRRERESERDRESKRERVDERESERKKHDGRARVYARETNGTNANLGSHIRARAFAPKNLFETFGKCHRGTSCCIYMCMYTYIHIYIYCTRRIHKHFRSMLTKTHASGTSCHIYISIHIQIYIYTYSNIYIYISHETHTKQTL